MIDKRKYHHWFIGKSTDLDKNLNETDIVLLAERQLLGALLMDDGHGEAISACHNASLLPTHFHDATHSFPSNYNARIYDAILSLKRGNIIAIAQYLNANKQLSRLDIPYFSDLLAKCWTYYIYPDCIEVIINHKNIPAPTVTGIVL